MTATNHGLFGAAIAVTLSTNPVLALAIAPFSHFLLDALPHYTDHSVDLKSIKFFRLLSFDAALAVITALIVAFVWVEIFWLVVACAFLAASPDLMWIYYEYINPKLKTKHWVPRFHSWIQWSTTVKGAYVEAAWYVVLFSMLVVSGLQA